MDDHKENNTVTAKMTSKNQVTIPKQIRTLLDIQSHDKIIFKINDKGEVILKSGNDKNSFWQKVEEQKAHYGPVDDSEVDWGNDIEIEDIDR